MSSEYPDLSTSILPATTFESEIQPHSESLEVIAQPCYTSKLRYRSDYTTNRNRRGALRSQTNPNYQSPTIRIPQFYLNSKEQYYIRICLVTTIYEKTNCRYVHPYELENTDLKDRNDREKNAVWYPIHGKKDIGGIKSFPNLRIVKKKADFLTNHGDLQAFDYYNANPVPQLSSAKETIKEYNLERSQLAFTIGKKIDTNEAYPFIPYLQTTVYSEEMIENVGQESNVDNESAESVMASSNSSTSSKCTVYKYVPQNGYTEGNEDVLIFFNNKLKVKKYGELQVTFECDTSQGHWLQSVLDLEVKDQMVSFKTPQFPFPIAELTPVKIIFRQKKRSLEPLEFLYMPISECPKCQRNMIRNQNITSRTNPNKRGISTVYEDDDETDGGLIPAWNNKPPEIRESHSEPETLTFSTTSYPVFTPLINISEQCEQLLNKLADSIELLFINNDLTSFLRICRPFIKKRPELLHNAISNNQSDLVSKFIPMASIDLLRQKNQFGETVLLHATRLNRINIVKDLLEKNDSDKLLDDVDDKKQNIFHILALNTNSQEILEFLINHLAEKSINIPEKFDCVDQNNHTPLQVTISNNNLSATRHLLKYFTCETSIHNGNAVVYDDLARIRHLINHIKRVGIYHQPEDNENSIYT